MGIAIAGCSADPVEALAKFKSKFKLNFTLLSNADFKMIEAYGARRMKSFLGKSFLGIVRSSVLISPDGEIEMVWPNAKSKGHASETLAAVEAGNLQSK